MTCLSPTAGVKHEIGLACELIQPFPPRLLALDTDSNGGPEAAQVPDTLRRSFRYSTLDQPRTHATTRRRGVWATMSATDVLLHRACSCLFVRMWGS